MFTVASTAPPMTALLSRPRPPNSDVPPITAAPTAKSRVFPAPDAGDTLLFAVGAAVIGGTSLFGGRGRLSNAVIGGAVLATVNNGLGLLGQPASVVFLVNGLVLLLAAGVDVVSRRRSAAAGR